MSSSSFQVETESAVEPATEESGGRSLRSLLLRGGMAMGVAAGLERGLNFFSNLLAARIAGPELFGAYSLVLVTASTIATYAGAGIGTTANRFAGAFPRESPQYRGLLRALVIISVSSAAVAAGFLFVGAAPFARLFLRNENLTNFLRLAAFSAGVMILLECCRGLLIGQQRFPALLLLSSVAGLGLLIFLPQAAAIGPGAMILTQACVGLSAISVCVIFARRLGVLPPRHSAGDVAHATSQAGPGIRDVFTFGMVQLGAVIGLNIAGWWITSLVARADVTLLQMGIYAVANQFRQLINIIPDLLARLCYPLLTSEKGREYGGHNHVIQINTFVITALAISTSCAVLSLLPFVLNHLYGRSYAAAELPSALLIATAVVHMCGAPAANRLNIVNLRATGIMNAVWTVLIISLGSLIIPRAGAAGAAGLFLITHIISAALTLLILRGYEKVPRGLTRLTLVAIVGALMIAALAFARIRLSAHALALTLSLVCLHLMILFILLIVMRQEGWRPGKFGLRSLMTAFRGK